jgi:hypothetical protein
LKQLAPEWPIDQIARMDRIVLRIGLFELTHHSDVPPKVVINEAVELAKAFGGENSSKFINGVLGTVIRQRDGDTGETDTSASETPAVTEAEPEPTIDTPAETETESNASEATITPVTKTKKD